MYKPKKVGGATNHFLISVHISISTHFLTIQTYKRTCLTRVYGMWEALTATGIELKSFSGHSFRAGAATTAGKYGLPSATTV